MATSNYGIDILTKERLENILFEINTNLWLDDFWGPIVEKDGKYYISTIREGTYESDEWSDSYRGDPNRAKFYEVTKVIDRSMSPDKVKELLSNEYHRNPPYSPKHSYDADEISTYIDEVQNTLRSVIGRIDINDDGSVDIYDIDGNKMVDKTKITKSTDPNSTNKYDLSDIEKLVPEREEITLDTKLDDSNKGIIENYLNDLAESKDIKLELNEDGFYIAEVNGERIVFDNNLTLGEAIYKIQEEIQQGKILSDYSKSARTNRINHAANAKRIYLHVPTFESINGIYSTVEGIVSDAKGSYNIGCLTDKLNQFHSSFESPTKKLAGTVNLASTLQANIKYSLKAYENIDHSLGIIINSIISEIFSMNKYEDLETEGFYAAKTVEEREEILDGIIEDYQTKLENLKKDYEEKYPDDKIWFNKNIATLLGGIGYAFDVVDVGKIPNVDDNYGINVSGFTKVIDLIKEHDLLSKLKTYSKGASWVDSGLDDVYHLLHKDSGYIRSSAEKVFLDSYLAYQSEPVFDEWRREYFVGVYGFSSHGMDGYSFSTEQIEIIKNHMRNQLTQVDSLKKTVQNLENGEDQKLSGLALLKYYCDDIASDEEAISTVNAQLSKYKKYRDIMPYEADMQGDIYLEYLVQDWSKLDLSKCDSWVQYELGDNIKYMSQQEIALYMMYRGILPDGAEFSLDGKRYANADSDKAEGYMKAMLDLINQRHGLEEAVLRYQAYKNWAENEGTWGNIKVFLSSGWDGINEGIDNFMDGVKNVIAADGILDSNAYRDAFFLSLLSNDLSNPDVSDVYNLLGLSSMDENFSKVLKRNYSVFKSIGTMTIPTIASFIPYVGPGLSKTLYGLYSLGSSAESMMIMQMANNGETNAAKAYLYGGLSAASNIVLNKFSGIIGLNGKIKIPGKLEFVTNMIKAGGKAMVGVWTDAVLRSAILDKPIDLSGYDSATAEAAINAIFTAAIMNGVNIAGIKLANKFVYHFSENYNSYEDLMLDCRSKFYASTIGQKLRFIKTLGGRLGKEQDLKYDKTIVGKWLKEVDDENKNPLYDLTSEADKILQNVKLQQGQHLMLDAERMNYYIYDEGTNAAIRIPNNALNTSEGLMFIKLTQEEKEFGNSIREGNYEEPFLQSDATNPTIVSKSSSYDFFHEYGYVNQDALHQMTPEQRELAIQYAIVRLGMKRSEAKVLIDSVNQGRGACSYAAQLHVIVGMYLDKYGDNAADAFKNDFGFSLVKDGKINETIMLLDLYAKSNVGGLVTETVNANGTSSYGINPKYLIRFEGRLNTEGQKFLGNRNGLDVVALDAYLKKSNSSVSSDDYYWWSSSTKSVNPDIYDFSQDAYLGIHSGTTIYSTKTGKPFIMPSRASHAVTPVGTTTKGILVGTWGGEGVIPFSSIKKYPGVLTEAGPGSGDF